ncbi:VCBS repeat-containing protein [Candidatus Wolfebacteria bacterium]|nr:VCBS repeat-containing protein [Candidatus Wolfebacteria bacterium]
MKMKIRQAVLPFMLLGLLFFVAYDSNSSTIPPVAKANNLETGAQLNGAGIGVAIADMNGDGHLDIVSAGPNGVKYFESDGNGGYFDRGVIAETGAQLNSAGIGVAVADLDGNGISDIVIAGPNGIRIFKNPIRQKK